MSLGLNSCALMTMKHSFSGEITSSGWLFDRNLGHDALYLLLLDSLAMGRAGDPAIANFDVRPLHSAPGDAKDTLLLAWMG